MDPNLETPPLFDDVLETYYDQILRFVYKQVNNIEDAKDLTQDIFLKTFKKYHTYNPKKASIKTWLFNIANNHVINFWKSAYKRYKFDYEFPEDVASDDEDILEKMIKKEDVTYVLSVMKDVLNKKHFKIINLYFFSNLKTKEIAQSLKMNPKTVSNVISLSIRKIKQKLEGSSHERL